jgi:hypothetical protein
MFKLVTITHDGKGGARERVTLAYDTYFEAVQRAFAWDFDYVESVAIESNGESTVLYDNKVRVF